MTDNDFPKMAVDPKRPGVIRYQGADELTGILAGLHAAEIVRRCNSYPALFRAVELALNDSDRESTRKVLRAALHEAINY